MAIQGDLCTIVIIEKTFIAQSSLFRGTLSIQGYRDILGEGLFFIW